MKPMFLRHGIPFTLLVPLLAVSICGAKAAKETTLYSFKGGTDGDRPAAGLINANGVFYGTTEYGGAGACQGGCGTVFSVTPAGVERVIYAFKGGTDAAYPAAKLTYFDGVLYGTSLSGGSGSCAGETVCGTVFSVTPAGVESVLHEFSGATGDFGPQGPVTETRGTLFGATQFRGTDPGAIYSLTLSGKFTVLHNFGNGNDGVQPTGGLVSDKGLLYGNTATYATCPYVSCGTVYSITPAGAETVLYRLGASKTGNTPIGQLLNIGDNLYGTTVEGGHDRHGAIFQVTHTGTPTYLRYFTKQDGITQGDFIKSGESLVGVSSGGSNADGVAYKVPIAEGKIKWLYSFGASATDGQGPQSPLVELGGAYYGVTSGGGAGDCGGYGCGTVFKLTN